MKIVRILNYVLAAVVAALFLAIIVPQFLGIQYYMVLSGSMEPQIHVGSEVYVDTNDKDIQVGNIIVFQLDTGQHVTHRVIGVNENGEYITKGDSNNAKDANPVKQENVVGKVIGSIPYLGYVLNYIHNHKVFICLCIGVWLIVSNVMAWKPKASKKKKIKV